jgi:diguanylate cyclase (GGDEF)-like protein
MAFGNRNIWTAFYMIVGFWFLIATALVYKTYNNLYQDVVLEQTSLSRLTANTLRGKLQQFETVIKVLSSELAVFDQVPDKSQVDRILANAIQVDDFLLDFVVLTPDGRAYESNSDDVDFTALNLLENPATQESFLRTLGSQDIVIGRTYFSEPLQQLIFPIRHAVRNSTNHVIFVVSAALSVERFFEFITLQEKEWQLYDSFVFREHDRYFQLAPMKTRSDLASYDTPVPQHYIDESIKHFEQINTITFDGFKHSGDVAVNQLRHEDRQSVSTSVYLEKYGIWLSSEIKVNHIVQQSFYSVLQPLSILVIALLIIFWLFKNIERSNNNARLALQDQAELDYLTQLHNRFYLDRVFKQRHQSKSEPYSVLFIDIDKFKIINDQYGPLMADQVLKTFATLLRQVFDNNDILVRHNSDEFLVVTSITDNQQLAKMLREAKQVLSTGISVDDYVFKLSCSVGVAAYPQSGSTIDEVIQHAEIALYESKKQRNQVTFFDAAHKHSYVKATQIEYQLRTALDNKELFLVYQPQLDHHGELSGIEALIRWDNPHLGRVPPDKFIPIAESSGEIADIGLFVLKQAFNDTLEVIESSKTSLNLSINVSVKQLQRNSFYADLIAIINQNPHFHPSQLTIEVTENVFIEDVLEINAMLSQLAQFGIRISLDDFGTGFSSLSLLRNLSIHELKIDKSFIDDMLIDQRAHSMLEGIISIADKMNFATVAEGVETLEQFNALQKFGCDIYQGYYFAKPLTKAQLKEYIANKPQRLPHSLVS